MQHPAEITALNDRLANVLGAPREPTDWGLEADRHQELARSYEARLANHAAWLEAVAARDPKVRAFYRLTDAEVASTKAVAARHRELARMCAERAQLMAGE